MIIKSPKIKCTTQEIDTLVKVYNVTRSTVFNALCFRNNSETSKAVRDHAVKIFGHEIYYEEKNV